MEIFIFIVFLVFAIVLISVVTGNSRSFKALKDEMERLRKEIAKLNTIKEHQTTTTAMSVEVNQKPEIAQEIITPKEEIVRPPLEIKQEPTRIISAAPKTQKDIAVNIPPSHSPEQKQAKKPSWFTQFLRDNPDIEKFIGENLINKIGIAILVLGIAFFVKYAIDQDWINKVGRVCIGLFCGAILIGLAHGLRKNYHSFSSVLVGGGLSVFYFTIAFAFHQYQLITQIAAFVIMIVITLFAVILSVLYDRLELGVIATIGGFITPFLVSNGSGNYVALFTYVAILNAGLIFLAYYKRWRVLNFLAFVFTQVIYLGWIFGKAGDVNFPYQNTFIFGAVFYLMFVSMNVIHHVVRASSLKTFDFIILLSVNLFFYGSGVYLFFLWNKGVYSGIFTASLGAVNFILAYLFFKRSKADKNFIYLLIAITLTFVSLAAPVQLHGHYITLFWAAETVVLLWLYQRSFIKMFKVSLLLVSMLAIISLVIDWSAIYLINGAVNPIIFNKGFVTGIFSASAILICYNLLKKEADFFYLNGITNRLVKQTFLLLSIAIFFCSGAFEIFYQFEKRFPESQLDYVYMQLFLVAFSFLVFAILQKLKPNLDHKRILTLPLIVSVLYFINLNNVLESETFVLSSNKWRPYFMGTWLSAILLLLFLAVTIQYIKRNNAQLVKSLSMYSWLVCIAIIALISFEVMHLTIWVNYNGPASIYQSESLYSKAGLSIVWGLSSFVIMWLGMSNKYKPLRIIALVVFGITLIKLFAYDISNITPGGKIVAFILLGILLLIISFMYQRLKKIVIDAGNK
jgi:uncharacterized membrane protein